MYIHIYCCSTLDQYKCICMSEWESLRECECELCLAPLPWILEILDGHIYYQNWNAMGAHAQHLSSPCPPSPWPSARASAQPRPAHSVVLFYLPNPAQPMGWSGHHGLPIWAHGLQCSSQHHQRPNYESESALLFLFLHMSSFQTIQKGKQSQGSSLFLVVIL
jgi:hypothetical protein